MNMHNVKNYTEQGGEVTHIGGKLIFDEGAEVIGLPSPSGGMIEKQDASTASSVAALKNDFNALILKMKDAGVMEADAMNITVRLAPSLTDSVAAANNAKATVALADGVITITADVDELEESESSAPGQGTHKWIGLGIGTGIADLAKVRYNGSYLSAADAAEAQSVGLDQAGEFVLYVRADELVSTPKIITLKGDGCEEVSITISVSDE